ncbi:MAG: diguanylate cyclase [Rhizobacter sp.]
MKLAAPVREGRLRHRLQVMGPFIVVGGLLTILWSVVLVSSSIQQERIANDALQQLRLINNAVSQQTRGLLQGIESDLQVLDHWVQAHPDIDPRQDTALAGLMARLNEGTDGLVELGFASGSGASVMVPGAPLWQAGMPAIGWDAPGKTHVGVPLRGAPDQPWRWPVSRRLSHPAGDITGAVAWVDIAKLGTLHEGLREKQAGAIMLTKSDAVIIARTPVIDDLIGHELRQKGYPSLLPVGTSQGVFTYDGSLTGARGDRTVSYERLGSYPITVLVSQGVDQTMATFRSRRMALLVFLGLITLLAFGFSVVLARSQRTTRQSQAEFAALSASFPLGLFCTNTSGETTYANDAYFQALGVPRERLAWGWNEALEESQREVAKSAWKETVAKGRTMKSAMTIQRDGQRVMLSVRSGPLHVDGKLVGQVGSLEDITERTQQKQAQRMLTAIFEKSTDIVAQVDPQGRMLYLNPAGRAVLNMGSTESLGELRYDDFMPAHCEAQVRDEIMPTAIAKGIWVGETSVLASGGREIAVSEMLIVHRDEERRIEMFSVVMRDITGELRARMELQRSGSILDIVASTLPASVAVLDDQQRYLFTNAAFNRLMRRPGSETLGKTMRAVLDSTSYAQRVPHIEAALAGRRTMFESQREVDGNFFFLETTYIPFRGADGRVAGFVGLGQDVTAHKRQAQKLLDASQTDALTGTLNRAGFDLRIGEALVRAHQEAHLLALLCIDLDDFKPVNDAHGHAAGDALLKAVAHRLQQALRPSDVLARLGGDEFAVVLADIKDGKSAQTVARKIVSTLGAAFEIEGKSVCIGCSVGVALALNGQDTALTLMHRADAALYQAKRAGRGRFEMAEHVA